MDNVNLAQACRGCGASDFVEVLNLGSQPLANAFIPADQLNKPEFVAPLVLYICRACLLVQLRHVVAPEILFRSYDYLTNASAPLVQHFRSLAKELLSRFPLSTQELVVEIGSNDGTLLREFQSSARVLGIDPAANVAAIASQMGVETVTEFFSEGLAKRLVARVGTAKLILANNVFAHIDDMADVMAGVRTLLSEDGVAVIEVHWVGNLIGEGGFDQIYHEHLCYYSLHSFGQMVRRSGLMVADVELVPMHGQSLRLFVSKGAHKNEAALERMRALEREHGLDQIETFQGFATRAGATIAELQGLLGTLATQGARVVGYGAPAKGNTLLNAIKATPADIRYIIDTTPLKQGKFAPGTHIPVVNPEKLRADPPTHVLLLAWNYADAILKKEQALRDAGVKFIIPVPRVSIV